MEPHPVRAGEQLGQPDVNLPKPTQGPQLAAEFTARDVGIIKRDCLRLDNDAITAKESFQGDDGIVGEGVAGNRFCETAAESVDPAGGIAGRVDLGMPLPDPELVTPVYFHVGLCARAVRIEEPRLARYGADGWIGKVRHQVSQ